MTNNIEDFLFLKRHVYLDVEADSLNPSLIHCIVCQDLESEEVFTFTPNSPLGGHHDFKDSFISFTNQCSKFVGHNIIGFDRPAINKCFGFELIKLEQCVDTLVMSRLFRPTPEYDSKFKGDNRHGGHSLAAWGFRLGFHKTEFNDFSKFTQEMLEYCVRDTVLGIKIYNILLEEKQGFSDYSLQLEYEVAEILRVQENNGFYLDKNNANKLLLDTETILSEMDVKLQTLFPPVFKLVRNYKPKPTKSGSLSKVSERILNAYTNNADLKAEAKEDGSFDLFSKETFNPQSSLQIADRLLGLGWKPKKYTDKGNIKTDKATVSEALTELLQDNPKLEPLRCLQDYNIVADRNQKVMKWLELAKDDGYVHGRVNPIGASTHRCSHYDDNMANIARVVTGKIDKEKFIDLYGDPLSFNKFDFVSNNQIFLKDNGIEVEIALTGITGGFGWDSRNCWSVEDTNKYCLVGFDAAGIQLRALAHYMNDSEYTKQLLEGDIHEVNRIAAGIPTRSKAKTFIYAWLLGAGDEKVGTIVGCDEIEWEELFYFAKHRKKWNKTLFEYFVSSLREKGRKADRKTVATIIKGFKTKEDFLNRLPALKRFRMEEIPRAAKKGYVVGLDGRRIWVPNEHLAMGAYLQGFEAVVMKQAMSMYHKDLRNANIPFWQCAMVYDECQVKTLIEHSQRVGEAGVKGIRDAGEFFKCNLPLDGEWKAGKTWSQTH